MSRNIDELHEYARDSTGSHMYRCYNYSDDKVEFYCENCINDLPSYIDVESNPMANMFTKCESCGFQHKDFLADIFFLWFFVYPLVAFIAMSVMYHNMGMEFFMGKSIINYWSLRVIFSWLGGGLLMFLIRAIQKKIAKEW